MSRDPGSTQAEFAAPPSTILVHDPVPLGALDVMDRVADAATFEETTLFRARPDRAAYWTQHQTFVALLRAHASRVIYLRDLIGDHPAFRAAAQNPNQVFTRDSLITIPWLPDRYLRGRMAKPLRRAESDAMAAAVELLGLTELIRLPEELYLEGGDVIPFARDGRRSWLVGYGPRTRIETLRFLRDRLIPQALDEIVAIELAEWRMNLDGGLLPLADDVVVADSLSIRGGTLLDASGERPVDVLEMLRDLGMRIIDATRDESVYAQACNCVCLGGRKVICYDLCDRVYDLMLRHDLEVYRTPGSELVKGRGGPRCMTRPIYRRPV
jgi:N-dimethylarginine dimethylaminohydrolase